MISPIPLRLSALSVLLVALHLPAILAYVPGAPTAPAISTAVVPAPARTLAARAGCTVPQILSPSSGETIPNPTPTVVGSADAACGAPSLILGQPGGMPTTVVAALGADGRFTQTFGSAFPGQASVQARQNGADPGMVVTFTVPVSAAQPAGSGGAGGGGGRRALACGEGQDYCPNRNGRGRCVASLQSNIEQCGSCAGPDCSALPNVDSVKCENGRCIVESCAANFDLLDGECVRAELHIQEWLPVRKH